MLVVIRISITQPVACAKSRPRTLYDGTKQLDPISNKSSAESELVAASDGATPTINVLNIITCQGIQVKSLIIEQDNKSTLAMISIRRATGQTSSFYKHRNTMLNIN